MMNLYKARIIIDEFEGHEKVPVAWYVLSRNEPMTLPYKELIEDYNDEYSYAEGAVHKYFTAEEIEAFRHYLKERYGDDISVEEVHFPVSNDFAGYDVISEYLEPGEGNIDLYEVEEYSLPFKVQGFFDLYQSASSERERREAKQIIDRIQELSPLGKEQVLDALKDLLRLTASR